MAMGYPLSNLLGVVAREGIILSILGYAPAWLAGQLLYAMVRSSTGLPVQMETIRSLVVLAMIFTMCMASALLAMRKLADADPAEIF
jgi:putative ABC transport system permease protein